MSFEQKNKGWTSRMQKKIEEISKKEVAIGFPKNKSALGASHYEDGKSIIDVAVENNYGTDNIPRRDFMTPSGVKIKDFNEKVNKDIGKDIANGDVPVQEALKLLGIEGQAIIKEQITELKSPPNAPSTIEKKKSSNPLIDTGDMRNSVTFVIRNKK